MGLMLRLSVSGVGRVAGWLETRLCLLLERKSGIAKLLRSELCNLNPQGETTGFVVIPRRDLGSFNSSTRLVLKFKHFS
jgi:hypothetical protein